MSASRPIALALVCLCCATLAWSQSETGLTAAVASGQRQPTPPPLTLAPRILKLERAGIYTGDVRELPNTKPRIRIRPERHDPPVERYAVPNGEQPPAREPEAPVPRAPAPSPLSSYIGLDFATFGAGRPPDTVGDVGPAHFIQSVNSSLGIYRKSDGVRLAGFSLDTFFSQGNFGNLCDTDNFGDPVVLYDTFEDRWIITDFAFQVDGGGNVVNPPGMFQCFAASRSGDPLSGGWNFYSINTEGGLGDYGKFGIWPDGLYATFNMFDYAASGGFQSARVYALNKAQMYAGEAEVQLLRFDLPSEFTVLPANARLQTGTPPAGSPNPYAVVWNFLNVISVYKLQANWNALSTSTFTGPFDALTPSSWAPGPATVPAQGGTNNDTLQPRLMMQNQYTRFGAVESLWNTHTVQGASSTIAAPRFYQLDITGGTVAASTTQAFTHNLGDGISRYMPSLALDRTGNLLLGYSASSASLFPAIRYAGRFASDPLNTLPQTENSLIEGTGSQNTPGSFRWGDYAAMTLDPDGCTFWLTSEYYATTGTNWQTRWGAIRYPGCTSVGTGTLSGTVTNSAGGAPIAGATVQLGSRTTTTNGSGQYSFSGLPAGTYPVATAAAAGFGSSSVNAVVINAGATTTQNFSLTGQAAAACFTDTTMADFQTGVPSNLDLSAVPGSARLLAPDAVDQQNLSVTTSGFGMNATAWVAQTFQPAVSGSLTRAELNLFCSGCTGTTPNLTLSIRATTAGNLPTGPDLTSGTIPGFNSGAGGYFGVTFASPLTVTAGTRYAIVVRPVANPSAGTYAYVVSTGSPYANGRRATSANSGGTWSGQTNDLGFITYINSGFVAAGTQTSNTKNANPAPNLTAYWSTLSWNATLPANTTLRFQVAGSTSPSGPWNYVGPDSTSGSFFTTSGASLSQFDGYEHLRYRAFLSTTNGSVTPTLADVTVCHSNAATGSGDDQGLQVGAATLPATIAGANRVSRIAFNRPFTMPPVVIVQPSNENPDPVTLRITNVSRSGFDLLQVESPGCAGCSGSGATSTIHWLAAAPGSYRLRQNTEIPRADGSPGRRGSGPGPLLKVGTVTTSAVQRNTASGFAGWPVSSWQAVSFPAGEAFSAAPVVLNTVQSWNNEGPNLNGPVITLGGVSQIWSTAVANNITTTGFDVALEASEVDDDDVTPAGPNVAETIGYVALQRPVSSLLLPLGGGAEVGLATGNGTATDSCAAAVLSGLAFPAGPPVLANLRGFAGKHTRADADGGWLRRCAMTAPGGNQVSMTLLVDEDADLDAERAHPTTESFGAAIFGGDFTTTPITLAEVRAQRLGSTVQLDFSSATEVGHLGYRVWGRSDPESDWQLLSTQPLFSAKGDHLEGASYQLQVEAPAITEVRIEDIDLRGRSRFHAPVAVGSRTGAPVTRQPIDWPAIRAANARIPVRPARGADQPVEVQAAVVTAGIQRVRFEELAALGFPGGAPAASVAVLDEGRPVLRHIDCPSSTFGPGCVVEWLGQPRQSLYGADNQYTLSVQEALARPVGSGALVDAGAALRVGTVELVQAPNRSYTFSAPGNDPWYDERLLATTAPVETSRSFTLPERAPGPVILSVDLWGGLDFDAGTPDHSVELWLNGLPIAARRFDGLMQETIEVTLSEAQLAPVNTLTLRLPADTGLSADVVLLDGFRVRYPRFSRAHDGSLAFGALGSTIQVGTGTLLADGFEPRPGFRIEAVPAGAVMWTSAQGVIRRDALAGAQIAVAEEVEALYLAGPAQWHTPRLRLAAAPAEIGPADYLVITHPLFAEELGPLTALQQQRGHQVRVLRTDQIYAGYSDGEANPLAIRMAIADVWPRFVLLVGGDSYDYHDYLGLGSQSLLPTFYRAADPIVRFAASDFAYADADGDGSPEFALGRIPARTVDEWRRALTSLSERASEPPARWFASAGISGPGERFGLHSHSVLSPLRAGQQREFGLVDEVGLDTARTDLVNALAGGADWINYLGHSGPNRWAMQNLLDVSQLPGINRTGAPAIVSQFGCWSSYFVLPTQETMSAALQLRPNRLAAAVIGSTSLAEDASHLALATRLFDLVEDGVIEGHDRTAGNTLGDILKEAQRNLFQRAPEHRESIHSVTLFGDPAMPVR